MNMKNGNDLTEKTILLVNTGSIKKRFILQRLKKLGLKIVCLNKEKNWAQSYVDYWILADTTNYTEPISAVKEFIANNHEVKINGVVTFWEDDVLLTSKIADKFSLVRSCFHSAAAVHDTGHQMMQTGRLFTGGVNTPHVGCAAEFLLGRRSELPAHVILPETMGPTGGNMPHGQDAGFLGKAYDPFVLNSDPSQPDFKVPDLLPPKEIGEVRLERRRMMRDLVDSSVKNFESSEQAKLMDSNFESAYRIMTSSQAREAFDLAKEPLKVRERYGMNRFGQSCLLARRLVERGVRMVTVNTFITVFGEITWDIHGSKPFTSIEGMRDIVAPMYDQGYTALIEDLFQRGMLDDTMVTCLAEFGRTPKVNPAGGRDHWPNCWTVNFAGGGVKGGQVIGKSDEIGAYPAERPVDPGEIVATIYDSLGIDLHTELPGPQGRPYPVVDFGKHGIKELFG